MLSQRDSPGTVCSGAALGLFLKLSFLLGLPLLRLSPSNLSPCPFVLPLTPAQPSVPLPPSNLPPGSLGAGPPGAAQLRRGKAQGLSSGQISGE
jgi:hypothetical protein